MIVKHKEKRAMKKNLIKLFVKVKIFDNVVNVLFSGQWSTKFDLVIL